ncbi:MAG: putative Mannose-1-phosphate guanylyltransferase [Acidobacteria bacterium]|nr:putative Mannose-1-phosphate guanylyltransferase [Acidobacteriota bacterium]
MQKDLKWSDHLWSIILSGGEGKRTRPFIRRWLGMHKPKQYCAFAGTRSMLQHTVDRADALTSPERRVIVTKEAHARRGWLQLRGKNHGEIVSQPSDCGTAPGIFLPLAYVRAKDPDATVIVYPSDHFVYPEEHFVAAVRQAANVVEQLPHHLILLGASPTQAEPEYGWIWSDRTLHCEGGCCVMAVERFVEKPNPAEAQAALEAGALWNTMVFAAKAETLWKLGWRHVPEVMWRFEQIKDAIGLAVEKAMVASVYRTMPFRNFSHDLLMRAASQIAAIRLTGVAWSDWGKPERIADTLKQLGITPAFPSRCIA